VVEFKPQDIFATLDRHGVRYVLIGGMAAILYGSPNITNDVDIVPQEGPDNLERLSAALDALNARIRAAGEGSGVPFRHDGVSLAQVPIWNLVTDFGDLDITFVPSGTRGYDDLVREARAIALHRIQVPVASLADVIRSKEAAGRAKDRLVLPVLRRLLDEAQ
jgi:hypothetical protein